MKLILNSTRQTGKRMVLIVLVVAAARWIIAREKRLLYECEHGDLPLAPLATVRLPKELCVTDFHE